MSRSFKITILALSLVAVSLPIVFHCLGKTDYIGENILKAIKDNGNIRIDEKRPYSEYKDILDPFIQTYITETFQQNDTGVLWVTIIRRTIRGSSLMLDVALGFGPIEASWCGTNMHMDVVRLKFRKKNGKWQLKSQKTLPITTLFE